MSTGSPGVASAEALRTQLEPVRAALLDDARTSAGQLVAQARAEADEIIAAATAAADQEVHRAEQRARATVDARSEQRLERARADAHRHILQTRAALAGRLVQATQHAVLRLRDDPRYPELLDRLERLARSQLGPGAEIDRDPAPVGGIIARVGGRRVDYTLSALADRALTRLGDDIEQLWA